MMTVCHLSHLPVGAFCEMSKWDRFQPSRENRPWEKFGISKFLQFEGKISESILEISDFERVNCYVNSESIPSSTGAVSNWKIRNPTDSDFVETRRWPSVTALASWVDRFSKVPHHPDEGR